ncbi:MAG: LPS assembly protein LptD [Thermodesulfobacteriota bacterium]
MRTEHGSAHEKGLCSSRGLCLCLICVLWVFFASVSQAQELAVVEWIKEALTKEAGLLGKDATFELSSRGRTSAQKTDEGHIVRGDLTLRVGKAKLRADAVEYSEKSGLLTVSGNVRAQLGNDTVEAERIKFKPKELTGVIINGKLLLKGHNIYLEGKKLERISESSYKIEQGSFTTCDGSVPAWRIKGKDLDVTVEGYATLTHGVFFIKDIPVFYVPWLVYPAKRQRQTGFLMPTMANSTVRGLDAKFPFFINISPSADATIVPRICTKRALQTAVEVRYCPLEDLNGRFFGEYTYDWKYATGTGQRTNRVFLNWNHNQTLPGRFRIRANGNWVSDRNYFEFWGERLDRRRRLRYLESNLVLDRQWDDFMFQAEARHVDNLAISDNALTVQNLPILAGTAFNQKIPYTPLYFSSQVGFTHFFAPKANEQWLGSRWTMKGGVSLPFAIGNYLKLDPSMTYTARAYAADYFVKDRSINSINAIRTDLYQVDADLYTDLESVFGTRFLGFERIRHAVRPRVTWTFRPFSKHDTYPQFDETDKIDRISLLTAELRQSLTGRIAQGQYLDLLTLTVSQGFDLLKASEAMQDTFGTFPFDQAWTALHAQLTFKPHSLVDLTAQAEYDPVQNVAKRYSLDLGLMDHRGDLARIVHQYTQDPQGRNLNRQTNLNLQLKLTNSLDCFIENQYSHQFGFSYFTGVGLNYHPQCWAAELRFTESKEIDPATLKTRDPDQTVFLTLSLYGLGQVYRMTRDWGDLLGRPSEQIHKSTSKSP